MKEIRILINNLRQFPPNYFATPSIDLEKDANSGLDIFQYNNGKVEKVGHIDTGGDTNIVITK
jgi:hypothetical protein